MSETREQRYCTVCGSLLEFEQESERTVSYDGYTGQPIKAPGVRRIKCPRYFLGSGHYLRVFAYDKPPEWAVSANV